LQTAAVAALARNENCRVLIDTRTLERRRAGVMPTDRVAMMTTRAEPEPPP